MQLLVKQFNQEFTASVMQACGNNEMNDAEF